MPVVSLASLLSFPSPAEVTAFLFFCSSMAVTLGPLRPRPRSRAPLPRAIADSLGCRRGRGLRAREMGPCNNGVSHEGRQSTCELCEMNRRSGENVPFLPPPLLIYHDRKFKRQPRQANTCRIFPAKFPTMRDMGAVIQALSSCAAVKVERASCFPVFMVVMTGHDEMYISGASVPVAS